MPGSRQAASSVGVRRQHGRGCSTASCMLTRERSSFSLRPPLLRPAASSSQHTCRGHFAAQGRKSQQGQAPGSRHGASSAGAAHAYHAAAAALVVGPAHQADLLNLAIPGKHGQQVLLGAGGGDLPHKQARHACRTAEGCGSSGAALIPLELSPRISMAVQVLREQSVVHMVIVTGCRMWQQGMLSRRPVARWHCGQGGRCAEAPARQRASPKPPRALGVIQRHHRRI